MADGANEHRLDVRYYRSDGKEPGPAAFIAKALGDIARAKGMSRVACNAVLPQENLYKAFSGERNLTPDTLLRVIDSLGLKLRAEVLTGTLDSF